MSTLDDAPEATPIPPSRAARSPNTLAFEPERLRRDRARPADAPEADEAGQPSVRPGDVPSSLTRRYFTEALRGGAALAFYEGPGAKRIAFTDHGQRLSTDQTHPALVRDLAAVAAHRGWRLVRVTGADDFRREMWVEARALGLQVKGYRPTERDQQELDRKIEPTPTFAQRSGRQAAHAPRPPPTDAAPGAAVTRSPPDYDKGVSGVLIDAGQAPYRRRPGEPMTPFIRIDQGDGGLLDIWGVGLPDALSRSKARTGDVVQVRRDGVDVVQHTVEIPDPQTGVVGRRRRDGTRNRWIIEADRFRQASPAQAARDEDLNGAQSHLRILDSVIDGVVRDPERRARLRAEARELVADELARGRPFTAARIREVEPALAHDLAQAQAQDSHGERTRRR